MISKVAILLGCIAIAHSALIPTGYNFGYDINGGTDGQSREESGDAFGNVRGSYSIRDADGRQRKVHYTAGAGGFNAQIESNEPGVLSKSSANAQVNGAGFSSESSASLGLGSGEQLVPTGYKFGYDINGPADGQSREESGDASGAVVGSYSLRDADGRQRKVDYTADALGFRATINTNEQGTANKSPADVTLISPHPAPVPVEPLPAPQLEQPALPFSFQNEFTAPVQSYQKTIEHAPAPIATQTFISAPAAFVSAPGPVLSSYEKRIEHAPAPIATQTFVSAPVQQLTVAAPIEFSGQKTVQAPLEFSGQKTVQAPLEFPAPVYTSRSHSSLTFAKVATPQLELKSYQPVQQVEQVSLKSFEPMPQYQAPLEIAAPIQQKVFISAPAPVYTSRTHSSTSYAKIEQPAFEQKALLTEQAPIHQQLISAPVSLPVKGSSTTNYQPEQFEQRKW